MEDFEQAKKEYFIALESTVGMGAHGQAWVDKLWWKMKTAYDALEPDVREKVDLPRPIVCGDDGSAGLTFGMGSVLNER